MHWIDWLILLLPLAAILWLAFYCRRYVRGIADFLAAGRVAGRYVISVGDLQTSLAVVYLVATCESQYQCGMAMSFWNATIIPVGIFLSLTGYCVYRYRETRCLSIGQFLELRYSHRFRVIASAIRTVAEMMTNAIGPAVTARFFIYFLGLPLTVELFGVHIPTFALVLVAILGMAMAVIWPGGRISLLVTDALQGLMSYPIFVIFTVFILSELSWDQDIMPVMMDRIRGESFLNPTDIESLRDFNLFALFVTIVGMVLNRAAWIGNDTSSAGKTAHEQKMAGILGAWRNGFSYLMTVLLALFVITVMTAERFRPEASAVRQDLVSRVAEETLPDAELRRHIHTEIAALPQEPHRIGIDPPYSRNRNPDTGCLEKVQTHLNNTPIQRTWFQKFRTLYYQMMMPTLLRHKLPIGMMGIFALLMVMLMLSTDDSRIFNASATLVQDVVMPLRQRPFAKAEHLGWLRMMSLAVGGFFLTASLLLAQMDYLTMFLNIMCALWLGAAGPIMVGGLYSRWGTTFGAYCALIFGSGTSLTGLLLQRNWSATVYPWLEQAGLLPWVDTIFRKVTGLCEPYVIWEMNATKFPINSYEIYFLAMVFGIAAYVIGSWVSFRRPFDLNRMLHRAPDGRLSASCWSWRNAYEKLIGITPEYTFTDKIIAWSVFGYSIVYQFGIAFVAVAVWNWISPWPVNWWSWYFFINVVLVGIVAGVISTVWFMVGGIMDLRKLFRDLAGRVEDPGDDGWVTRKS